MTRHTTRHEHNYSTTKKNIDSDFINEIHPYIDQYVDVN